mmetsp:Transcript_112156/g.194364  ORF Transcript_112156/g.194364 Transcript_112156/m.194364 type:complete len:153 (-) Transcript_112156:61-519(-)
MAAMPKRYAWTFLKEGLKFRVGRLYETFFYSQSNVKYTLVLAYPGYLFYTRMQAETQFRYNVTITDEAIAPDDSKNLFTSWNQFGSGYYLPSTASVKDLKDAVYSGAAPPAVRAGCHGRMMEDADNLALAVRTFCKRDPRIIFWEEITDKAE